MSETAKTLCRQRLYQIARMDKGICPECPNQLPEGRRGLCTPCLAKKRVAEQKRNNRRPWQAGKAGRPPLSVTTEKPA